MTRERRTDENRSLSIPRFWKLAAASVVLILAPFVASYLWREATGHFEYVEFAREYLLPGGYPLVRAVETDRDLRLDYPLREVVRNGEKPTFIWEPSSQLRDYFEGNWPVSYLDDGMLGRLLDDANLTELDKADEIFSAPHPDEIIRDSLMPSFPPPLDYKALALRQGVAQQAAAGSAELVRVVASNSVAWVTSSKPDLTAALLFGRRGQYLGHIIVLRGTPTSPESVLFAK